MTALLAMLYLALIASLAVGFYASANSASMVSENEKRTTMALTACESGMDFMRFHMYNVTIPYGTTQAQLFTTLYNQLKGQLENTGNLNFVWHNICRYYGAYCASKFAVIALTQTLALELASEHINVNAICPGVIVETGMRDRAEVELKAMGLPSAAERVSAIPLGRLGKPDDVARIAAFLASDEAAYMTGQSINVTGGLWLS